MKIARKNMPLMMIYLVVFLVVSLVMTSSLAGEQKVEEPFTRVKSKMAFINEENSPLVEGLREELSKIAEFVELPDETEALQDALFFRKVTYILRVPEGFTGKFMSGEDVQLEKTIIPDSAGNVYIDLSIDKYLNAARLYIKNIGGITQESLVSRLQEDFSLSAPVKMQAPAGRQKDQSYARFFFNYMAYSLLSILILGITAIMLVFNDKGLRMRNACSPVNATSINVQFMLAGAVLTVAAWMIMVMCCLFFNLENALSINTVYFILNSFVFALCGSSLSFLIGNLAKSQDVASAVCNVVTLGFSFISGVFVPQEYLAELVLKIASFTPSYWFVRANNKIGEMTKFDLSSLMEVFSDMLVQVAFAVAFLGIALVAGKKRRYLE